MPRSPKQNRPRGRPRLRARRSTPTRCSWSSSPPLTPGTSSRGLKPWWRPAGRRARSVCSPWIRADTSARGPTATAGPCSAEPLARLLTHPALIASLGEGELRVTGRLLEASNATFLAELSGPCGPIECVYKPVEGERPLWDFPHRTLGYREVAAYEVSRIGGGARPPEAGVTRRPPGPRAPPG